MKKIFVLVLLSTTSLPLVALANSGDMMSFGMMNGWMMNGSGWGWGAMFSGLIWILLVSFVFSLVFWLVYKWIIKK